MKNKIFIIIFFVALAGLVFSFRYHKVASVMKEELQRERYTRMTAEENLQKAADKLSTLQSQLTKIEKKNGALESEVDQFTALNADLQSRLEEAAKRKDVVEAQPQGIEVSAAENQQAKTEVQSVKEQN